MGFVVATESVLRPRAFFGPGSLLNFQASLLHSRLRYYNDIACSRGTNITGTLALTLSFYLLPGWLPNWFQASTLMGFVVAAKSAPGPERTSASGLPSTTLKEKCA